MKRTGPKTPYSKPAEARIQIRIPSALKRQLQRRAKAAGRSLSVWIVESLTK